MSAADTAALARDREWNRTESPYPRDSTLADLFTRQVRGAPHRTALSWDSGSLTYGELYDRALALAEVLAAQGAGPGEIVAVALPRSADGVVAIWAALLSGAAYLPLDPADPAARLRVLLEDSAVRLVVVDSERPPALPGTVTAVAVNSSDSRRRSPQARFAPAEATSPAYVIHTSGSTGTPRGVLVPHRGPVRLVSGAGSLLQIHSSDTVLATTNLTFDVSTLEIFGALLNGARLVLPSTELLLSPDDLARSIRDERISVMWLSAGLFHQHATTHPHMFRTLRRFLAGGDALSPAAVRAVLSEGPPEMLLNGYGPTENSGLSTVHHVREPADDELTVPIGRPVNNSTAWVVREDGGLALPGEEGELWVGGDGVALGYHRSPEATARRFVPDRFAARPTGRLYRTGDMARRRDDGVIEFLGRRDRQIKIRGFRVELREIELVLASEPTVNQAAVLVEEDGRGDKRLRAWVVGDGRSDAERLRRHLRDHLPAHMVPAALHLTDRLPLTAHGKVDRVALAARPHTATAPERTGPPPSTATGRTVAAVWGDLLSVAEVSQDDDFFALGGQSLQAAQVSSAVRIALALPPDTGRELIRLLLANPTLADYATGVDRLREAPRPDAGRTAGFFEEEARLGPEPRFDGPRPLSAAVPHSVLLTGASGFLGVHLIEQLAAAGVGRIHCLVRAADAAAAWRRIAARMRRYGVDPSPLARVVVPLAGDLGAPDLGLGAEVFRDLARDTDVIVHAGSHVNFAYPYEALRAPNVEGTRTVLRLAATTRVKPVHYVSSIAVIAGFGVSGVSHVDEDERLRFPERISLGYPETKWVAERLVTQAGERGLPVSVYRPYEITGTRDRGLWNTDTMMCALFRTIAVTGLAPDMPLPLDFVPVDYTAAAIVHILGTQPPSGLTYHLANPRAALLPLLVDRLRASGRAVRTLAYEEWVARLARLCAADPQHPMAPYLPMFAEHAAGSDITVKEMYLAGTFPAFSSGNASQALKGSGLNCPPVDAALIDLYLDRFAASGFLPAPGEAGA